VALAVVPPVATPKVRMGVPVPGREKEKALPLRRWNSKRMRYRFKNF
jgi:hypothetical protein